MFGMIDRLNVILIEFMKYLMMMDVCILGDDVVNVKCGFWWWYVSVWAWIMLLNSEYVVVGW